MDEGKHARRGGAASVINGRRARLSSLTGKSMETVRRLLIGCLVHPPSDPLALAPLRILWGGGGVLKATANRSEHDRLLYQEEQPGVDGKIKEVM